MKTETELRSLQDHEIDEVGGAKPCVIVQETKIVLAEGTLVIGSVGTCAGGLPAIPYAVWTPA